MASMGQQATDTATGKICKGWSGAHLKADLTVKWQLTGRHGEQKFSEEHLWEPELSPLQLVFS